MGSGEDEGVDKAFVGTLARMIRDENFADTFRRLSVEEIWSDGCVVDWLVRMRGGDSATMGWVGSPLRLVESRTLQEGCRDSLEGFQDYSIEHRLSSSIWPSDGSAQV